MLEMSERDCSASNVKGIQMHRDNNRCDYYSTVVQYYCCHSWDCAKYVSQKDEAEEDAA